MRWESRLPPWRRGMHSLLPMHPEQSIRYWPPRRRFLRAPGRWRKRSCTLRGTCRRVRRFHPGTPILQRWSTPPSPMSTRKRSIALPSIWINNYSPNLSYIYPTTKEVIRYSAAWSPLTSVSVEEYHHCCQRQKQHHSHHAAHNPELERESAIT